MRSTRAARTPRGVQAFTLIEVLIGVLVLAIGLLGLGGLLSVVVRQQAVAVDVRQAQSARQTVELFFDPVSSIIDWDHLRRDFRMSLTVAAPSPCPSPQTLPLSVSVPQPQNYGRWEVAWNWQGRDSRLVTEFQDNALVQVGGGQAVSCVCPPGGINLANPNICDTVQQASTTVQEALATRLPPGGPPAALPVGTRLVPQAYSGVNVRPAVVWDFYPRRLPVSAGQRYEAAPLQVAVFIRAIDQGIRVPQGRSLSDVLTGTGPDRRFPVGADSGGLPTRDGTGSYAHARSMRIDVANPGPGVQRVTQVEMLGDATLQRLASQPGQKLVDSLGLVHTVVERDRDSPTRLTIEPGYSAAEAERIRVLDYREVVFTPQVPVDVFVKTIR
jgi:prepilin-type N-terminal cleavage/methylation domain-containing protein